MSGLCPVGSNHCSRLVHFENCIVSVCKGSHRADEEISSELLSDVKGKVNTLVLHTSEVLPRRLDKSGGHRNGSPLHEDVVSALVEEVHLEVCDPVQKTDFKADVSLVHLLPSKVRNGEVTLCHTVLVVIGLIAPPVLAERVPVVRDG